VDKVGQSWTQVDKLQYQIAILSSKMQYRLSPPKNKCKMEKKLVYVVFDRKKQLETKGVGKVDIILTLTRTSRKIFTFGECTARKWSKVSKSKDLLAEVTKYGQHTLARKGCQQCQSQFLVFLIDALADVA